MIGNYNYGTGRRKSAVARVFIKAGTGQIIVNGKPAAEYFSRETGLMVIRQPLELTGNVERFDIKVNVHGGGESGQAGAVRHGITRALIDYDAALKPDLARPVSSPATHVKSSVRKSACAKHVAQSNSRSVNSTAAPQRCCKKPPASSRRLFHLRARPADAEFLMAVKIADLGLHAERTRSTPLTSRRNLRRNRHDQSWHRRRHRLHGRGIAAPAGRPSRCAS